MHWEPLYLEVTGWLAGWRLWGHPDVLTRPSAGTTTSPSTPRDAGPDPRLGAGSPAPVTIVVPARDEATMLPGLLEDLRAERAAGRRVIVVDDHSTDGTGALARTSGVAEVVDAPELPPGWTGKPWACHIGVAAAGPVPADHLFVFLDADVRLAPGAIDAAVAEVAVRGGLVSVQPFHTTRRAYEQLSLFNGIVGLMGTGAGRPERPPVGAFGPLLATTAGDYAAVGGHASVRHEVAEDVALAQRYRDADRSVHILLGDELVRFRMYPHGLRQLAEGWTKNMATGAEAIAWHRTLLVAVWIAAAGSAVLSLPFVPGNSGVVPLVGLTVYTAFAAQVWAIGRRIGTFGWITAALYAIPLVAFVTLFARSAWRLHVRRSVRWRDRTISLHGTGAAP